MEFFDEKLGGLESDNFDLKLQLYYSNMRRGLVNEDLNLVSSHSEKLTSLIEDHSVDTMALREANDAAAKRISYLESEVLELKAKNEAKNDATIRSTSDTGLRGSPSIAKQLFPNITDIDAEGLCSLSNDTMQIDENRRLEKQAALTIATHDAILIRRLEGELAFLQLTHEADVTMVKDSTERVSISPKENIENDLRLITLDVTSQRLDAQVADLTAHLKATEILLEAEREAAITAGITAKALLDIPPVTPPINTINSATSSCRSSNRDAPELHEKHEKNEKYEFDKHEPVNHKSKRRESIKQQSVPPPIIKKNVPEMKEMKELKEEPHTSLENGFRKSIRSYPIQISQISQLSHTTTENIYEPSVLSSGRSSHRDNRDNRDKLYHGHESFMRSFEPDRRNDENDNEKDKEIKSLRLQNALLLETLQRERALLKGQEEALSHVRASAEEITLLEAEEIVRLESELSKSFKQADYWRKKCKLSEVHADQITLQLRQLEQLVSINSEQKSPSFEAQNYVKKSNFDTPTYVNIGAGRCAYQPAEMIRSRAAEMESTLADITTRVSKRYSAAH